MAYETPKAIHFDAYQDGKKLPPLDTAGLHARWHSANLLEDRLATGHTFSSDLVGECIAETNVVYDPIVVLRAENFPQLLTHRFNVETSHRRVNA